MAFDQHVGYVDWHREGAANAGISDDAVKAYQTTRFFLHTGAFECVPVALGGWRTSPSKLLHCMGGFQAWAHYLSQTKCNTPRIFVKWTCMAHFFEWTQQAQRRSMDS